MTMTQWLMGAALLCLVLVQIRGQKLTPRSVILPVGLLGWACVNYLHGFPAGFGDVVLIGAAAALGLGIGVAAGRTTRILSDIDGTAVAKAGVTAATLWIVGMGLRLAFQIFAGYGGAQTIGWVSMTFHLHPQAWATALLLMAVLQVAARTAIVWTRGYRATDRAKTIGTAVALAGSPS